MLQYSKWLQSAETKGGVEKREKKTITKDNGKKDNDKKDNDKKDNDKKTMTKKTMTKRQ